MKRRDPRQQQDSVSVDSAGEALDSVLEGILGATDGDASSLKKVGDKNIAQVSAADVASLLGIGGEGTPLAGQEAEGAAAEVGAEEWEDLLDEAYAGGRRLARVGNAVLVVAEDGMKAFFRGRLPQGTTHRQVMELLTEHGIRFGIIQSRLYDVLPRRRPRHRGERDRGIQEEMPEVVVALGQAPTPPAAARLVYKFRQATHEDDAEALKHVLQGYSVERVRGCRVSLPLVRPGQLLAELTQDAGAPGMDVFGEEIPPASPPEAAVNVGENVVLERGGRRCRAAIYGYAGVIQEQLTVIEPLWVSRDLMRVSFVFLPQDEEFPAPTQGELGELLARSGVIHGIQTEAIARLCEVLQRGKKIPRLTVIARGTPSVPGVDARWEFLCDPDLTRFFGQIQRAFQRSPQVRALAEDLQGMSAKAVSAGERLATKLPSQPGEMGTDVFGEEFVPDDPRDAQLEAGENTRLEAEGAACYAGIFGYLGIGGQGTQVQVISPLWLTPERMAAYFVRLPQLGQTRAPTTAEIDQLLALAGVQYGIDHKAVGVLCEKMKQGLPSPLAMPVARGRPARDGEDGRFEFAVDMTPRPGRFAADGSIDFKQLNLAPLVAEGELIGTRIPALPGRKGTDVTGGTLPARDGDELHVDVGANVRLATEEERQEKHAYHATLSGELVAIQRTLGGRPVLHLQVQQVMVIQGNVDFHTGHIDYPGSVHVQGSVQSGFQVKAAGNVIVADGVEEGAQVTAGGNVAVKHGIVGEQTRVRAQGAIFVKYISEADVHAGTDLDISEYSFNATLRADGEITVWGTTGSRSSGVIAGGTALARQCLRAVRIGTDAAEHTRIVVGVDPQLLRQATALQERIDQYNAAIGKTLGTLQVGRVAPEVLRHRLLDLVLRARGARRKMLARMVKNLLALQERLRETTERKRHLYAQMEDLALQASVQVTEEVTVNTVIRIGEHSLRIDDGAASLTHTRFTVHRDKKGQARLQMSAG